MKETDQKILEMTIDEFRKWEIPNEYRVIHISGEERYKERYGMPGVLDVYVHMRVVLEKK